MEFQIIIAILQGTDVSLASLKTADMQHYVQNATPHLVLTNPEL